MSDFGDVFGGLFSGDPIKRATDRLNDVNRANAQKRAASDLAKKLPKMRMRRVDGVAYLRAADVAAVLKALGNDRATAVAERIEAMP